MCQVFWILVISLLREKTNISVWLDHIVAKKQRHLSCSTQEILIKLSTFLTLLASKMLAAHHFANKFLLMCFRSTTWIDFLR